MMCMISSLEPVLSNSPCGDQIRLFGKDEASMCCCDGCDVGALGSCSSFMDETSIILLAFFKSIHLFSYQFIEIIVWNDFKPHKNH